jgi:hypothetical protein
LAEAGWAILPAHVTGAFDRQAEACAALGSPFTAALCALIARKGLPTGAVRDRIAAWPGDVSSNGDSVPLRMAGVLHRLALTGHALSTHYPPRAPVPDLSGIEAALPATLAEHEATVLAWLESPPQTNEIRRSAIIAFGLAHVAKRTGLPLALLELGASAGLNLMPDQLSIQLGERHFGDATAPLALDPDWSGPQPPAQSFSVAERAGCDIAPIDLADPHAMLRLQAYVWADQRDRMARLATARAMATRLGIAVEAADAVEWATRKLEHSQPGRCRVVFHTIAMQYMTDHARRELSGVISAAGLRATADAPLAHLAFEADGKAPGASVTLQFWPGGERMELGRADYHGRWIAAAVA